MTQKEEIEETAAKIRNMGAWWDPDLCRRLCALAGLEKEYLDADGETFEAVVFKAADILGVEII